jgi:hypothetical protein
MSLRALLKDISFGEKAAFSAAFAMIFRTVLQAVSAIPNSFFCIAQLLLRRTFISIKVFTFLMLISISRRFSYFWTMDTESILSSQIVAPSPANCEAVKQSRKYLKINGLLQASPSLVTAG